MTNELYQDPNAMAKIDGAKIRRLRETKGLTQLYLATFVGVTTDTVSRWENKRYQTIKQTNALKLAEALEVALDDILDRAEVQPDAEAAKFEEKDDQHSDLRRLAGQNPFLRLGVLAGFLLITSGLLFLLWRHGEPPLPTASGIRITAERYFPNHCAPNQLFPVVIRIHSNSLQPVSLIVKEEVPDGLAVSTSKPPFTASDNDGKVVRWLLKTDRKETQLFYLCKTPASPADGHQLFFSGSVTVKGQQPVTIESGSSFEIAPYHWADSNRDLKISDEEILSVYDYYSEFSEMGIDFDLIEEIWSANGYQWNSDSQTFAVVQ